MSNRLFHCRAVWALILAVVSSCLITGTPGVASNLESRAFKDERLPAVQFIGHDSRITQPRFVLVKDDAAWASLWSEHIGAAAGAGAMARHAAPKIDFSRYIVVGAFAGATTNQDGEVAEMVGIEAELVRVRYVPSTFQSASAIGGEPDRGVATTPYGLWVIERTEKPIVIEQGARGLKPEPIAWKEVKRFDGR